jgi:hypothetical protein
MTDVSTQLERLGDDLERAVAARIRARPRVPRKLLLAAAALAVAVPGIAFAASALITEEEVAASLPAGTAMLQGTEPRCTVVVPDVEYLCVLKNSPQPEIADMKGTVEPTVDASKHVNGGCRSLASDGKTWRCYIGRAAVEQKIIGPQFLGEYAPAPGRG